jgi:hypothetical protein
MKLIEKIRAAIARLGELSETELDSLRTDLGKCFDEVIDLETTPENLAIIDELYAGIESVMTRSDEIAVAKQEAEAKKDAARAVRAKLNGDESDAEGEAEGNTDGGGESESEGEAEANADSNKELVATGAKKSFKSSPAQMNRAVAPIKPTADVTPRAELLAAGNFPGKNVGEAFTTREELARVMSRKLFTMHKKASHGEVLIASADLTSIWPEDRKLKQDDITGNMLKIDAVTSLQALTASGGTCQPVNVDYSLDTWAIADRPVKTGLAQFQADRGGLQFRQPPTIASLAGATSVWTEATDANPAGATKPVLTIACASPQTVFVNAIPTRLQFGNLQGQFDPDTIAANTDLAIAAAARIAEVELLTLINAQCTQGITSASLLGASRDMFTTVDQISANFRWTHRLSPSQTLTVILPHWVKSIIRQDRVLELAHDSGSVDVFGVTDEWIDAQFMTRGIKVIWTLDAISGQNFGAFTASAAMPLYPTTIVWNLFIEGSFQFIDSGLLNLGVVRDATLDSTNDYETFVETFEGIAYRGFSGGALQIVSTTHARGGSSATVSIS